MLRTVLGLIMIVASTPTSSSVLTAHAQEPPSSLTKASALKNVQVSSLPGWFEAVSDECHFRILFPGKPEINDEIISIKGLRVSNSSGKWSASCADLGTTAPKDESELQKLYQHSMDAMTRNKTYLISSSDIYLNGRLGIEFRIRGLSQTSYTRALAVGRRLYTVSVSRKKTTEESADYPSDVQQFFNSFAYWD